ncbi:hypothetical protein [Sphingomonas sanxanigenens]|uniref:Uncharacterized protein n=1 Tax=Sphingomonas sanxanigenens DSM 19645 = NX02 TaxID=1123269 RepID=W0A5L2_9SPHN|nr:hypothetical protein [Sphingomonas sanxanigenens]AHE52341.1 hypothetical protein NX02_02920 [Sphingomonas sanxanigenens DSM 19645 = NX02]
METAPTRADARRWAARAGAGLLGLALAWVMVPDSLSALSLSRNDAATAAAQHPTDETLAAAGDAAFRNRRYAEARALADRALTHSLFNVVAWRVAGLSREAISADDESAASYMALAGQLGWRDTLTQLWYIDKASRLGEYEIALQRADALLRRQEYSDQVLGFVRAGALDPKIRPAILARLAEAPGWRPRLFLDARTMSEEQRQGVEALVGALRRTPHPVTRAEITPYIDTLIRAGAIGSAYRIYDLAFGATKAADGNRLHDPDFRQSAARGDVTTSPAQSFDWTISAPLGITTGFDPAGGLTIAIDPRRRGTVAQQLLALPAGAYRFDARLAGAVPQARELIRWTVECLPSRVEADAAPAEISQGAGATAMQFDFAVANDCPYQRLTAEAGASTIGSATTLTIRSVAIKPR